MEDEDNGVLRLLNRRVRRRVGTRTRTFTTMEAIVLALSERAMAGDLAAARELIKLAKAETEAEAARAADQEAQAREDARYAAQPPEASPLEKALIALGALSPEPSAYDGAWPGRNRLAAWVVDAAFAHDPGLRDRLTGYERFVVDGCLRAWTGGSGWLVEEHDAAIRAQGVAENGRGEG